MLKFTIHRVKPRNPLALPAKSRPAGRHNLVREGRGTRRQLQDRAIEMALRERQGP